ncbi:MAG TPA: hypothetical protein VM513_05795 [Kofleriaceae bacterium]|jgi:hypothetical protein|nr:hypothetical protein [Kofleriaceae bacterium]
MRALLLLTLIACTSAARPSLAPCPAPAAGVPPSTAREEPSGERAAGDPVAALRALGLPERCALSGALADNLMNLVEWLNLFDKYTANNRATLVVFVDGTTDKLIGEAERCRPTHVRTLWRGQRIRVEHAGAELPLEPHLLLLLDHERSNAGAQRFTFTWPLDRGYRGNHPTPPFQIPVRHGVTTTGPPAPRIELEVQRAGDTLAVTRFEVVMWRRDGAAK